MIEPTADTPYRVAVPLANPANVWPLVTLACGLAGYHGGEIVTFCVVKDRVQSELGGDRSPWIQAQQRLAMAVEAAHRWEVPVRSEMIVHRSVADAIVEKTRSAAARLLVMGWRSPLPRRAGFTPAEIDRVVEQVGCDVAILKPAPRQGAFRRILIADLRGEHAALATQVSVAVAHRFGAELYRLEVARPEEGKGTASAGISVVVGSERTVPSERRRIMLADSTPEGILGAARGFDLVVVGTVRRSLSRELLYGNRLSGIVRRANASILIVRAGSGGQ